MFSKESLEGINSDQKSSSILIFGEVLYDCFSSGERVLGGAPFNVAWGLRGFGQSPLFVSAVGDDADGQKVKENMRAWGLSTEALQTDSEHATGIVEVVTDNNEPSYEICEDRAWDFINDEGWCASGVIYHGLLALRSPQNQKTLEALVERSDAQRFFDINLRPPYDSQDLIEKWIHDVDWLKLNTDELESLLGGAPIHFDDAVMAIEALRNRYGVRNVLLTGGQKGALIYGEVGQATCIPAKEASNFVDTVGAGDSFAASTIDGLLKGLTLDQIVSRASEFAAKVCSMQGATTHKENFYT